MSKQTIWALLRHKGFSKIATAAIMGNMEAESNCVANRLQGDFTEGYTRSTEYTRQVDNADISRKDFIYNGPGGGGYGLCQWTYYSRKAGLYDTAERQGVSIGDEAAQIDWLLIELNTPEFKPVLDILNSSNSIRECSDAMVKRFLRPADQSEAVLALRAKYGREIYEDFADEEELPVPSSTASGPPSPSGEGLDAEINLEIDEKELALQIVNAMRNLLIAILDF